MHTIAVSLACALILASSAVHGQNTAPQESRCKNTIDGHVVDDIIHDPIEDATISINGKAVAITDAQGRFSLRSVCDGEIEIVVTLPGYRHASKTLSLQRSTSVEIALVPQWSEVVVIDGKEIRQTNMRSTAVVGGEALERTRGRSFSEALEQVPGVSQLRSANGMAKPIVRGQFGRRLLLLVDSIPHRSQEWGLDHAPEIDPFSAGEIRVVRGAAGVRYGSGAIGGVVLVDPPKLLEQPGLRGEAHLLGFIARGGGFAARLQAVPRQLPQLSYQLQASAKRLASPSTPEYALQNTGSLEWNVGGKLAYRSREAEYTLSYQHYQAKLGVCACLQIESSADFFAQLQRDKPINSDLFSSELRIDRPYQIAAHDQAQARGRWAIADVGKVIATYALQFDHRQEFAQVRQTTEPQFDFRLTTHDADVTLEHHSIHFSDHLHLSGEWGAAAMGQVHSYRGLPLVPSFQAFSGGIFAIERLSGHDFEIEVGVRYDALSRTAELARNDHLRLVRSGQLAADSCDDNGDVVDCDSAFHTVSASVGGLLQLSEPWSIKLDLSTASRPPSPDEQYLNGTAPTFPVLGLGNPDLGPETTYSASLTSTYNGEYIAAEASGYVNFISDYIYFAPAFDQAGAPIFDVLIRGSFPRFITRAVDAIFYGADGGVAIRPVPQLELSGQLSVVRARNHSDDGFLVLVPSDRIRTSATYTYNTQNDAESIFASLAGNFVARQRRFDQAADLATPPDAYFLLDAELGGQTQMSGRTLKFALHATNLLNSRYRDYTSLLRYFADQPGLQIMLRLSLHFGLDEN